MGFDVFQLDRIRNYLKARSVNFEEQKMFMGLCILVEDKMLCGIHSDSKTGESVLLCRVSDSDFQKAIELPFVRPMVMNKRASKNFLFVEEGGFRTDSEFANWMQLCLKYNPDAKSSKKKKAALRKKV